MAAEKWHFRLDLQGENESPELGDVPVVPHFTSRIVHAVAWNDTEHRQQLSGQPIPVLEVEIPDRKERTLEQYLAVKEAIKGLEQIFPVRVF